MPDRTPAVAGRFYPADPAACRHMLTQCLPEKPDNACANLHLLGGVMPHAGWPFSGSVAARVASVLAHNRPFDTLVLFGAVHYWPGERCAIYPSGRWLTPLGAIEVDADLAAKVLATDTEIFESNVTAHDAEHSIEVELPFFQTLLPAVRVLPIMVPPEAHPVEAGTLVARACKNKNVTFIASSDLTHYGPAYGFTPKGIGESGLRWAKEVNDRRIIEKMIALDAESIVKEAATHQNACGAGAIAATIAACRDQGATRGLLLDHAHSHVIAAERFGETSQDSVGYAAIVFGREA